MFEDFKRRMVKKFEMTDIGLMAHFLGIEVVQSEKVSSSLRVSMQKKF